MDNLHEIFLAEANELISELENALLKLEDDRNNNDCISSVFRSMHTLKGSAGMFGMDSVRDLTHRIENIYDDIRNGKSILTTEIFDTTLQSIDHLKKILDDYELLDPTLKVEHTNLLLKIENLNRSEESKEIDVMEENNNSGDHRQGTYYIFCNPKKQTRDDEIGRIFLIEDLQGMGENLLLTDLNDKPKYSNQNSDSEFFGFEMILVTQKTIQDIKDVFIFVEKDCEITVYKIDDDNLFSDKKNVANLKKGKDFINSNGKSIRSIIENHETVNPALNTSVQKTRVVSNIRVSSDRLDEFMNLISELVTTQASLSLHAERNQSQELDSITESIEKITRRLRDNAFSMSLVPLENLVVRFKRLVRDLSHDLKKDVVFTTEGTDTEIDKSIIEKISDPLLHIIRNSLDHGIESPAERTKKGKSKSGTIKLKAYYSGANVCIEVSDDGAGIDLEKVKKKSIKKGLVSADAELTEKDLFELIFLPGFTTVDKVTDVSGRGVGMDVVKRNISDMRGDITIDTKKDEGTTFKIKLPLTLSIIDGLLVKIGPTDFILPLSLVKKCFEVETRNLKETFNQWVTLDGIRTPFLFLRKEFDITDEDPQYSQVICIEFEESIIGLTVDKIIGEYQAVLKPLGEIYRSQDEFSGSTILGDGAVALVLDPIRLTKKILNEQNIDRKKFLETNS